MKSAERRRLTFSSSRKYLRNVLADRIPIMKQICSCLNPCAESCCTSCRSFGVGSILRNAIFFHSFCFLVRLSLSRPTDFSVITDTPFVGPEPLGHILSFAIDFERHTLRGLLAADAHRHADWARALGVDHFVQRCADGISKEPDDGWVLARTRHLVRR